MRLEIKTMACGGPVLVLVLGMAASACMGFDVGPASEEEMAAYGQQAQELYFRFDAPSADEMAPVDEVSGPDLVGEVVACGWDSVTVAIRNQGDTATQAMACGDVCFDQFQTTVWIGSIGFPHWHADVEAGEEKILTYRKRAGREVRVRVYVDDWGDAVAESNENNNYSEAYCVH